MMPVLPTTADNRARVAKYAFTAFGLRIGIEIEPVELVDEAMRRLPPVRQPIEWTDLDREILLLRAKRPYGERRFALQVDGQPAIAPMAGAIALDRFEDVIQYYVAEFADPWLFVHAGVVGWQGRAIVLPGRSHSGKSTLTAALVNAGATYLSDEYAVLDAEGRVHPYPRWLSLREGPIGPAGRVDLSDRTLPVGASLPVGLVAALRYDVDAGWEVEDLTPAQAVLALCDNTVAIQRRPAETLAIHARVAKAARAIKGTRGELAESVERLLRMTPSRVYDAGE